MAQENNNTQKKSGEKKHETLKNEPGRTPGQAEGEAGGESVDNALGEPGRTEGQAEGERDGQKEYELQREEVRNHMKNNSSNTNQMLQESMNKARHSLEDGLNQVQRSINEDGALSRVRDQFKQAAASQGLESGDLKRWLALIGGGYLVFQGIRRSLGNLSLAGIGVALFYWGLSGESLLKALQNSGNTTHSDAESRIRSGEHHLVNLAASPKQVTKSIIVKAKVADVFEVWSNFENFPHFMENIKSIRKTGDDYSHWVMEGPFGTKLEWDAKTTRFEENKRIGWNSIQGDLKTSGQVTFNSLPDGETEVTVTLQYVPPAGLAGEAVAALFDDPETRLLEDLRNFKGYVEKSKSGERSQNGTRSNKESNNTKS